MTLNSHINNTWTAGQGDTITLINPCTGKPAGELTFASSEQVESALATARNAFPAWASTALSEREAILKSYAGLLESNREALAQAIADDAGKPLWEANIEAGAMIGKIAISIGAHESRCATFGNAPSVTRYRPQGVVVVLGPFNFPGHLANGHIVPALLAGNTIVFKPSEMAPRTANLMVELMLESGVPAEALQLVHGDGAVGAQLTSSDQPNAIFFTGSSATGKRIAAANINRPGRMIALEMGGNNPLVIADIDDIEAAALTIIQSAFITAGQRCTCARRLIVIDSPKSSALLERLVTMTQSLVIGAPSSTPTPFMGPVISATSAQRVIDAQNELLANGAKCLLEAKIITENTGLVSPAILDVTDATDLSDDEVFGPLLQVVRVTDLDAAIAEANNTSYGLAAGLLSTNPADYDRFRFEVRAGLINWNTQLTGASSAAPFGGVGDSGNQRPSAYFAADYCSFPVASMENDAVALPASLPPGIEVHPAQ